MVFPGESELARRMRDLDWSQTPLGDPATWPENLRVPLGICLMSRFPMQLWWGRELTLLYNDACASFLGPKHPAALARSGGDTWAEVWHQLGPMVDQVFSGGAATWSEDTPMFFARSVATEEVFVTFSFSPVLGAGGSVDGMFCASTETTVKIVGRRRLETLRELGANAPVAHSLEEAAHAAINVLAKNPKDVPFASLYLVNADGTPGRAHTVGSKPDLSEHVATALRNQAPVEIALHGAVGGPWNDPMHHAIALPLRVHEHVVGVLVIGASARRPFDREYRTFFDLVAGHISTALADADSYEEAQRRAQSLVELERAKLASEAKDEFLAILGHELRNPLVPILTAIQVVRDTGQAFPELMQMVEQQARHMSRLLDDLLDVSRIANRKLELRRELVELGHVVDRGVDLVGQVLFRDQLTVTVPTGLVIDADVARLAQVFSNLIANALKYTPAGTPIQIVAEAYGATVRVMVRDQGPGIDPQLISRIFEPFTQAPQSRARAVGGLGLGLAIVRSVIELHDGSITVESGADGTTFTIALPVVAHRIPGAAQSPPVVAAQPRIHVLVVDDNRAAAQALQIGLRMLGCEVDVAHDGIEALEIVGQRAPTVALLDLGLPGMDGCELATRLRQHSPVALIALTGYGSEADRERTREAGFAHHLLKPVDLRQLHRTIVSVAAGAAAPGR
jgi:signal transduction histidine kinase/ActR/RegA family two-component response regulator